jgi:hypothetical protein
MYVCQVLPERNGNHHRSHDVQEQAPSGKGQEFDDSLHSLPLAAILGPARRQVNAERSVTPELDEIDARLGIYE